MAVRRNTCGHPSRCRARSLIGLWRDRRRTNRGRCAAMTMSWRSPIAILLLALCAFAFAYLVLPSLVLAVALTLFFTRTGLLAGIWRLIAAHVIVCTPYVLRVSLPVLRRFDHTLEEASRNLGATPIATFFLVVLPIVRPGIV